MRDVNTDLGDAYFEFNSGDVTLYGQNRFQLTQSDFVIFANPGQIVFEQGDGILYLTTPSSLEGSNTLSFPFDSGRIDNHNVTSLGTDAFSGTATNDTVTIAGALETDLYFIQASGSIAPNANDRFAVEALDGKLIVHRASSGTSGLVYNWRRLRQ